jgi:hypothetical protein
MRGWASWLGMGLFGAICGGFLGFLVAAGMAAASTDGMTALVAFATVPLGALLGVMAAALWAWWHLKGN